MIEGKVNIKGEELVGERVRRFVVWNKKSRGYAVYLGRGGSLGYFRAQPIKKSGQLSKRPAFFAQESGWFYVGTIDRLVAARQKDLPKSKVGKALFTFFSHEYEPRYYWHENIELWKDSFMVGSEAYFGDELERRLKEAIGERTSGSDDG